MNKKVLVFYPGDVANVQIHFTATKTTVLKVEAIEIDNSDNGNILVDFDL